MSPKPQFCAINPRRCKDPSKHCCFQAKLSISSRRSSWCCHVNNCHSSLQMWPQRAQLFLLSTTQTQLHQVPSDYTVIKPMQLKEEFSPKVMSSLAAIHNERYNTTWCKVFPSDWRLWTGGNPNLKRQCYIPGDCILHVYMTQNHSGHLLFTRPSLSF